MLSKGISSFHILWLGTNELIVGITVLEYREQRGPKNIEQFEKNRKREDRITYYMSLCSSFRQETMNTLSLSDLSSIRLFLDVYCIWHL